MSVPAPVWGLSSQDFKNDPAFLRLHFRCRHRRHHFIGHCGDRNLGKAARQQGIEEARKRTAKPYRSGRSPRWVKVKNPKAPAVKREAEEDWGVKTIGLLLPQPNAGVDFEPRICAVPGYHEVILHLVRLSIPN